MSLNGFETAAQTLARIEQEEREEAMSRPSDLPPGVSITDPHINPPNFDVIDHPGPWRYSPVGGLVTTYVIRDRNGDIVAEGIDEVRIAEFFAEMWDEWQQWGETP